jgi:hypothetical protein
MKMEKEILSRIKNKYDTLENWERNNLVLLKGEIAFVIKDFNIDFKIGDGQTNFKDLPLYKDTIINGESFKAILQSKADKSELGNYLTKEEYIIGESGGSIGLIEPKNSDIPKVFINGNIPTTKDTVLAELTYISKTLTFHSYIEIKCQGTSSMKYPKKNFTIKLFEDEARS